jgi:hypothetical protein
MVVVNILVFLGEIPCVSFHIDQEFRLEFKDRWEKYTPPTSMAAGIFVGTEPQFSGWSQSRSLIAAEGRAEVEVNSGCSAHMNSAARSIR